MKYITAREMRELEKNSGLHPDVLMERAGKEVAEEILNTFLCKERERKVLVLCGAGNNGGDGLVAARYLLEHGAEVYCYIIPSEKGYKELVMKNLKRAFFTHLSVKEIEDYNELETSIKEAAVVVDALLGTGFEGELKEPYKKIISLLNALNKTVVSVDVPSGMAVEAQCVYALGFPKAGLENYSGKIKILDIGLT